MIKIHTDDGETTVTLQREGHAPVEVTFYFGEHDGVPVVQIDTHDEVRVNLNNAELATVHDGGDRIVLPEHWREYERPS